jgi:tRNA A-37 threonylcarbamoyl transferase component Bud32
MMNPEEAVEPDDRVDLLLAACDEAVAGGISPEAVIKSDTPVEVRSRIEREVAWCRLVRRLLPGAGLEASSDANTFFHSAPYRAPSLSQLGRFHIRRELGRGGFGLVFLAFDPKLGREVALKVPRPEAIMHPELRSRFQHEARATASLEHPNLVPVYESGEDGAICYIASAYCPGITLSAWLKERKEPVPFGLAAQLVATLAEAVEHAHRRGILHRDLKPANIMLSPREASAEATTANSSLPTIQISEMEFIPRIMDFGLAKVLQDEDNAETREYLTQTGAILGTPAYMAPEQAGGQSRSIGPATDVYGLGVILYELLTGRPPFRGDGTVDTLVQVQTREPLSPGKLRSKLPRDLQTICLKCLQKDPRKRYPTAQALADDLQRYSTRRPIEARRTGILGRGLLWCQRNPALAATIALASLAVSVVSGAGLHQVFQERERYREERDRSREERDRAQANLYRPDYSPKLRQSGLLCRRKG